MEITAITPMQIPGQPPRLYVFDAETGNVYGIDFEGESETLSGGAYHQRFVGENPATKKRFKRLLVEGEGVGATTTVTLEMDNGRTHTQELSGPYESREEMLFFTELDPATVTGRTLLVRLDDIAGTGVKIRDTRAEYTPIDGG